MRIGPEPSARKLESALRRCEEWLAVPYPPCRSSWMQSRPSRASPWHSGTSPRDHGALPYAATHPLEKRSTLLSTESDRSVPARSNQDGDAGGATPMTGCSDGEH